MSVLHYSHDTHHTKDLIMTKKQVAEWITLSEAARRPQCPVSRQTLHAMIERGEIPRDAIDVRSFGECRTITYIDANILADLPYRYPGQRGKAKD